jgi:hypothetical protein
MTTNSNAPASATQGWKPHALANPHAGQLNLSMGDTVRSTVELNGVRYRVRFANGIEVGDLDQRNIEPTGKAAKRLAKIAKRAQ